MIMIVVERRLSSINDMGVGEVFYWVERDLEGSGREWEDGDKMISFQKRGWQDMGARQRALRGEQELDEE